MWSPGWPGTLRTDQAGPEFSEILFCLLSAGLKVYTTVLGKHSGILYLCERLWSLLGKGKLRESYWRPGCSPFLCVLGGLQD